MTDVDDEFLQCETTMHLRALTPAYKMSVLPLAPCCCFKIHYLRVFVDA